MNSKRDGGELLQAREADARLGARVRRASLLWWAAANVILCLLNFTTEPQKAWATDLVGYAGGSLAGLGWSLLIARRLTYERRRLRREAVWEALGLAALGGCVCGAVAGLLSLSAIDNLKFDVILAAQFAGFVGSYAELCVGWCFIYLVISGAERLARIEEEVSALRVLAHDSQSEVLRNQFRLDVTPIVFAELEEFLSLRRQTEAQDVVVAVAAKLRGALNRWPGVAGSIDRPEAITDEAGWGDADCGAPDPVVRAVMNLNIGNAMFWAAIFAFFLVTMEPYYAVSGGIRGSLLNPVCWFVFCVTGFFACMVLELASSFLLTQAWWVRCVCGAVLSVATSYVSAFVPYLIWLSMAKHAADIQAYLAFVFYYGCAFLAWYCLYFYAQAVRSEVTQRAVLAQAAEAAAAARNSMLRYQVRPHFLFNALNALYTLIADRRWTAARSMTRALSEYLERAFAEDGRELVPIGEQLEALQAYLGIEKIRFGNRLRFRAEVPEALAGACAPSLILHPLIENAMKYAVAATADPVEVEIAADRVGDTLLLRIRDSGGDPEAPGAPGLGIGLRNVAARLAGHYGERGSLRCKRLTPKGFVAEIRLPLEFACTPSAA